MAAQNIQFSDLLNEAVNRPGILSEAYSAFVNYSLGNRLAAAVQCAMRDIPLGPIASFKAWQDQGRQVKKGEKALALCMPVSCTAEKENPATGEAEAFTYSRFIWRNNWFVLSQTEGEDYPHEIVMPSWDKAAALVVLDITEAEFNHPSGNCQGYAADRLIAVSPLAQYPHKTRFHELAHVVLGHTVEHALSDSDATPRDIKEVEAESVAFILCNILDLPGKDESRGYIQHWLSGQEINEKSAQKIFAAADRILKAGQDCE